MVMMGLRDVQEQTISHEAERKEEVKHPPLDEIPPPCLPLRALHPVLI